MRNNSGLKGQYMYGKIIVVNLNPCVDWVCMVPKFVHGGLNRVRRVRSDVAGKGVNVAVALKNLGLEPLLTGFNFVENGAILTEKLDAQGIRHDFVQTDGTIRVNMKLYEGNSDVMTEINQPGAFVCEDAQQRLLEKIQLSGEGDEDGILVLSGSRPEGVQADFYAKICKIWRGKVFLDTEGDALRLALSAAPFALKPNLFELESTFGQKFSFVAFPAEREGELVPSPLEIADFCRERFLPQRVNSVCVSMGEHGAVHVSANGAFFCPALRVPVRGLAGAGDAMVAGLVYALTKNLPQEITLQTAMATAAASVTLEGTQMCTAENFFEMQKIMPCVIRI